MRILVTGCTPTQVNTPIKPIQKIDVPASIVTALREEGHQVEWRKVPVGQRIDQFDALITLMAPVTSLNGRHGCGVFWAMDQGLPTVAFFDDWQVDNTVKAGRSLARRKLFQLLKVMPNGERFYFDRLDDLEAYAEPVIRVAGEFGSGPWTRWHPMFPTFAGWGDRSVIHKFLPLVEARGVGSTYIDPSPTIRPPDGWEPPLPEGKSREWVLAALMPHDYWLSRTKLGWPLALFGAKKLKATRLRSEDDVVRECASRWGILCPPYMHRGSGWWRSRYLYSAWGRSVLACHRMDADALDEGLSKNVYRHTIAEYEGMTDRELVTVAMEQRGRIQVLVGSYDDFHRSLGDALRRARLVISG